jgi:hypothetical protein
MEHPNLYNGAQNVSVGPGFTQSAMDSVFPGLVLILLLLHYFSLPLQQY